MRITVGSLKGGVGKTTTAVHLALGLAREGRTLLVDSDPEQSSAWRWKEAAIEEWPESCVVVVEQSRRLAQEINRHAQGYEHVVIDTGPKNPGMLRGAMSVADVLVVPTAPRPLELAELPATFDLAAEVDATHPLLAAVLLVQVRTGTRSALEARQLLTDDLGLPVFDAQTRLRESYALAYGTVPADLGDYEDVLTEIRKDGMTA